MIDGIEYERELERKMRLNLLRSIAFLRGKGEKFLKVRNGLGGKKKNKSASI